MLEQAAHKKSGFILLDSEAYEAIALVAQSPLVESEVTREEGRTAESDEQWDDFIVVHPRTANIIPNLTGRNSPTFQELALIC